MHRSQFVSGKIECYALLSGMSLINEKGKHTGLLNFYSSFQKAVSDIYLLVESNAYYNSCVKFTNSITIIF